jgi:hypothetical protein
VEALTPERFESLERHARDGRRGLGGEPQRATTLHSARELNVLAGSAANQPTP